jgi:hypothetical protein
VSCVLNSYHFSSGCELELTSSILTLPIGIEAVATEHCKEPSMGIDNKAY